MRPSLPRSRRIRSAAPFALTCASKAAPRARANGDCEAPDAWGNPAWAAISALSAPAASRTARRAHPGLAVSAATVRAVWLSGPVVPRSVSSRASAEVTELSLPGKRRDIRLTGGRCRCSAGMALSRVPNSCSASSSCCLARRAACARSSWSCAEWMSSSARAAAAIVFGGHAAAGAPGRRRGCSWRSAAAAAPPSWLAGAGAAQGAAVSAVRIAADRKSARGLSGPMIRCSSGQVLTHSSARAGASRSDVSAGHR